MTALYMYDGAYSPNLATCKRHGAIAMSHYMTRGYASSSPQPAAVRNLGMGALLNAEGYAAELKGATRAKGRAFAEEALATVEAGVPRDGTVKILYSVDTDLTDLSVCDNAFRGINDVHVGDKTGLQVGLYGEGGLIERLHKMGLVQGGQWLSMSEGFGGFTHALKSGLVAVVQMHDAAGNWIGTDIPGTDRNTIINPHTLGAWWPTGSPYIAAPVVPVSAPTSRRKHMFGVFTVDHTTLPAGIAWPGWFTFDGANVRHIRGVEHNVNNGQGALDAAGQAHAAAVSYQQYLDWKAGK